jgi:predicted nucleotidyltransferase
MRPEIESKRERIVEICRKYHVRRLAVFGSAVRSDFDPKHSDIDLLLELGSTLETRAEDYFGFTREVEELFGRNVDIVESGAVKNRIVREEIDRTKVLLYAA